MYEKPIIKVNDKGDYSADSARKIDNWLHVSGDLDDFIFYESNNEIKDR